MLGEATTTEAPARAGARVREEASPRSPTRSSIPARRSATARKNAIDCPAPGSAYHGQDAQYLGNQPDYTTTTDGLTVLDNVTGLTWQRSPDTNGDGQLTADDKLAFDAAKARCEDINASTFGGFDDWRLPSIKELYSLIDFGGTDPSGFEGSDTSSLTPFLDSHFHFAYGDTSAGERIIDAQYASSTLYVDEGWTDSDQMFGVNFADGRIKGYDLVMPGGGPRLSLCSAFGAIQRTGSMPSWTTATRRSPSG